MSISVLRNSLKLVVFFLLPIVVVVCMFYFIPKIFKDANTPQPVPGQVIVPDKFLSRYISDLKDNEVAIISTSAIDVDQNGYMWVARNCTIWDDGPNTGLVITKNGEGYTLSITRKDCKWSKRTLWDREGNYRPVMEIIYEDK